MRTYVQATLALSSNTPQHPVCISTPQLPNSEFQIYVSNIYLPIQTHSQSVQSLHMTHMVTGRCQRHQSDQRLALISQRPTTEQPYLSADGQHMVPASTRCALHTRGCVWSLTLPFCRQAGLWLWVDQRIIGGVDDPVCVRPHWPRGPHVIGDAEYAPNQSKSARHQAQRAWT